jgi:hypothetical protein
MAFDHLVHFFTKNRNFILEIKKQDSFNRPIIFFRRIGIDINIPTKAKKPANDYLQVFAIFDSESGDPAGIRA